MRRGATLVGLYALALAAGCHLIGGAGDLEFVDGPRSNGSECTIAEDCASGNCVQGVCCDLVCADECGQCGLEGSRGTCVFELGSKCSGGFCLASAECSNAVLGEVVFAGTGDGHDVAGEGLILGDDILFAFGTGAGAPTFFGDIEVQIATEEWGALGRISSQGHELVTYSSGRKPSVRDDAVLGWGQLAALGGGAFVAGGTLAGPVDFAGSNVELAIGGQMVVAGLSGWSSQDIFHVAKGPQGTLPMPLLQDLAVRDGVVAVAFEEPDLGQRHPRVEFRDASDGAKVGVTRAWDMNADLDLDLSRGGGIEAIAYDAAGSLWTVGWYTDDGVTYDEQPLPANPSFQLRPAVVRYTDPFDGSTGATVALATAPPTARVTAVTSSAAAVHLGGGTVDPLAFSKSGGGQVTVETDGEGEDAFVVALDQSDPSLAEWAFSFSASIGTKTKVNSIAIGPNGEVVFGGEFTDGGMNFVGEEVTVRKQERAGFVAKLVDGNLEWVQSLRGGGAGRVTWVGVTDDGSVWVAGEAIGDVFGIAPPSYLRTDRINAFLARYEP